MSSSFIAIKVITNNGSQYIAKLESGEADIDAETHDGTFRLTRDEFEAVDGVSELFDKVFSWFIESLGLGVDEVDMNEVLNIHGSGSITEIRLLRKSDIRYIGIFSREEYWDEPFGASFIAYDYLTKAFDEEHRDEFPYSDYEDSYGDNLYERFLSESGITKATENVYTKNESQRESSVSISAAATGDNITLGGMTWTILAVDGSNALVLADKCIGEQPYNRQCKEITWENCTLRKWLNDDYYKNLPEEEKDIIVDVENENPANANTGISGGEKTKDKLFLLSLEEINMYLPNNSDRAIGEYWRLRTPGEEQRQAIVINPDGSIDESDCWVEFKYGVRPAAWIKMN